MCLHLSKNPGEYSDFKAHTLSMWAGPQHWCFKPCHTSNANSEKETRKRNVKKVLELNFDENVDFEAYFHKTKASVTLAKFILESQKVRSTRLPADFNYNPQNFLQLFLKHLVKLNRTSEPVITLENRAEKGQPTTGHQQGKPLHRGQGKNQTFHPKREHQSKATAEHQQPPSTSWEMKRFLSHFIPWQH
ncbi:hypothetical protein BTVI_138477 [Pitangus sulphuratus]|nr:hypothetical protein BTVI_138477 [Pitangus sulphuratus]